MTKKKCDERRKISNVDDRFCEIEKTNEINEINEIEKETENDEFSTAI